MKSGRAWRTELQNASVVCPDRSLPEASVMVPESASGSVTPASSKSVSAA